MNARIHNRGKVKNIVIVGRLWFNQNKGQTYHTATVFVNGKCVGKTGRTYGYGEHYVWTAFQMLKEKKILWFTGPNPSNPYQDCREHKISLEMTAVTVGLKRHL